MFYLTIIIISILELSEMIIIKNPTQTPTIPSQSIECIQTLAIPNESNEYTHWSRNVTLKLIEEYEKKQKNVGNEICSFKILYDS